MKITIDTKEDPAEEIKQAIRMLASLVDAKINVNVGEESQQAVTEAMTNFFGEEGQQPQQLNEQPQAENAPVDLDEFLRRAREKARGATEPSKDEDLDDVRVVPY